MMIVKIIITVTATLLFFTSLPVRSYADEDAGVIIVNAKSSITELTKKEVMKLFFGKMKKLEGNTKAEPIFQLSSLPIHSLFRNVVLNRTQKQLASYIAIQVFSGHMSKITLAGSSQEVIDLISMNPGGVGYIESSNVTELVKVVYLFSPVAD